jgi:hypothetical protein
MVIQLRLIIYRRMTWGAKYFKVPYDGAIYRLLVNRGHVYNLYLNTQIIKLLICLIFE